MLFKNDYNFSLPGLSNYLLLVNHQISISNPFLNLPIFNEDIIVTKAVVTFYCNVTFANAMMGIFYSCNNETEEIDKSITINSNSITFDLSKLFFFKKQLTGTFSLKNYSVSAAVLLANGHNLHIEYHHRNTIYKTKNCISDNLNADFSYYFDYLKQDLLIKRKLLNNITKFDLSICYSSQMKNKQFWLLPKGWKFSFLDYLIIELDNNDLVENLSYVDKDNIEHHLGVGIGAAFAAGFSGTHIGVGLSGMFVSISASAFAGSVIGASVGLITGGIQSTLTGFNWSWEEAAKGFAWGGFSGATCGAYGAITHSLASSLGIKHLSKQIFNYAGIGLVAVGTNKVRTLLEKEKLSNINNILSFSFEGFEGAVSGSIPFILFLNIILSLFEGLLEDIIDSEL